MVAQCRQPANWTPRETEAFFRDGIVPDEPPDVTWDPAELPDVFFPRPDDDVPYDFNTVGSSWYDTDDPNPIELDGELYDWEHDRLDDEPGSDQVHPAWW